MRVLGASSSGTIAVSANARSRATSGLHRMLIGMLRQPGATTRTT